MKAARWKKIESTEVLNHPRMHLTEDIVELPGGSIENSEDIIAAANRELSRNLV